MSIVPVKIGYGTYNIFDRYRGGRTVSSDGDLRRLIETITRSYANRDLMLIHRNATDRPGTFVYLGKRSGTRVYPGEKIAAMTKAAAMLRAAGLTTEHYADQGVVYIGAL